MRPWPVVRTAWPALLRVSTARAGSSQHPGATSSAASVLLPLPLRSPQRRRNVLPSLWAGQVVLAGAVPHHCTLRCSPGELPFPTVARTRATQTD